MFRSRRVAFDTSPSIYRLRDAVLDTSLSRLASEQGKQQKTSVENKRDRGEGEDGDSKNVSLEKPSCRKTFPSSQLALNEIPMIKRGLEEVMMKGVSKVLEGEM